MTNDSKFPAMNTASPPDARAHFVGALMGKLDEYAAAIRDDNGDWKSRVRAEIREAFYVAATVGQGSATSGEAREALAIAYDVLALAAATTADPNTAKLAGDNLPRLAAALAASAEQSNSAGAARDEQAEDMAFLMTGHRDRSGDCFKVLGETLFDAGYHKGSPPVAERAAAPASVPEGYVLVPVEPTPAMVDATFNHPQECDGQPESHNTRNKRVYRAMISAAPEVAQPAAQGESEESK